MYGVSCSAQTAHKPVHQSTIVLIYIPCIQDIHSARSVEKFVEIIKSMNFVGVSGRINFPKVNGVHGHSRRSNIKVSSLSLLPKILYAQFYIEWAYVQSCMICIAFIDTLEIKGLRSFLLNCD